MIARSIIGKNIDEVRSALEFCIEETTKETGKAFVPTLAFVFISYKQDRGAIRDLLVERNIMVMGATTSGEFIDKEISEGGIAIMLLDIKPQYFKLDFYETSGDSSYETALAIGQNSKELFKEATIILLTAWLHTDGEAIIEGIEKGYGGTPKIYGGMAGDDLSLVGPVVFNDKRESASGIMALIIDAKYVEINGIATCGWKPIGISKTVTKSEGNIVYTIDDQPALDLVLKYLGLDLEEEGAITNTVFNLGAYYPLQLEREGYSPVMRTAMLGNIEDRSLVCAGNVPQGAKVKFSLPPDFDAIETVVEECKGLKNAHTEKPDAVIMFSCVSRYLSFGILTSEEIDLVQEVWNVPYIGFFTYGEFGKAKGGKHDFHNNTCSVVTLKEI